ncbi:MAG: hypothetical protein IJ660_05305 [Alphaproteobacteria bacterium]|nr:hypothetical protein [Alphaproteobacteria bacterium]
MKTLVTLHDLTGQIQNYVRRIKARQSVAQSIIFEENHISLPQSQEIRSNINKLDGGNKFNIQTMVNSEKAHSTSAEYAAEAYTHLAHLDNKNKVVIDFMHKNNRNYDIDV